jgi:DNA-binding cell septation regulator SpoVG
MAGTPIEVTEVHVRLAPPRDRELGLLAFVGLTVGGGLRLDGLTLRRGRSGDCYVAFPFRTDARGRERFYSRPLDEATKSAIEESVLAELVRMQGEASRPVARGGGS